MSQYQRKRQGLNNAFTNILLINACSASLGSGLLPMRSSIMHTHAHTRSASTNPEEAPHTHTHTHVAAGSRNSTHHLQLTYYFILSELCIYLFICPSIHPPRFISYSTHTSDNQLQNFSVGGLNYFSCSHSHLAGPLAPSLIWSKLIDTQCDRNPLKTL